MKFKETYYIVKCTLDKSDEYYSEVCKEKIWSDKKDEAKIFNYRSSVECIMDLSFRLFGEDFNKENILIMLEDCQ